MLTLFIFYYYRTRVAKLRLADRMLIYFKLDYQEAWPPMQKNLIYINIFKYEKNLYTNIYSIIIYIYNYYTIYIFAKDHIYKCRITVHN